MRSKRLTLHDVAAAGRAARVAVGVALRAGRAAWQQRNAPPRAVLIDLDSLGVPDRRALILLREVLARAAPYRQAVAAGHPSTAARLETVCASLNITVLPTGRGPEAADRALLTWAGSAARRVIAELAVVSHDRAFAAAPLPYLLIVTGRLPAARVLHQRAVAVHHLLEPLL